jgi:hypothetical protein
LQHGAVEIEMRREPPLVTEERRDTHRPARDHGSRNQKLHDRELVFEPSAARGGKVSTVRATVVREHSDHDLSPTLARHLHNVAQKRCHQGINCRRADVCVDVALGQIDDHCSRATVLVVAVPTAMLSVTAAATVPGTTGSMIRSPLPSVATIMAPMRAPRMGTKKFQSVLEMDSRKPRASETLVDGAVGVFAGNKRVKRRIRRRQSDGIHE